MMKRHEHSGRLIWASLLVALAMWCFSYWMSNQGWNIGGEKTLISKFDFARQRWNPAGERSPDSVVFINVAHDRCLVPCYERNTKEPIGNTAIVDRAKLLALVQYLAANPSYRYVLIDVLFDDAVATDADSALFSLLETMPRVVIPRQPGLPMADTLLYSKTGLANYQTSLLESDFLKYSYWVDGEASMPLKMYEDITGRSLRRLGPLYFDGWWPARRSMVLPFDVLAGNYVNNLGAYLDMPLWEGGPSGDALLDDPLYNNFAGKYVVVGSFGDDDMHNTYAGMVSGPEININATFALMHGYHRLSLWVALMLFALFYWFSYKTLNQTSIAAIVGRRLQRSKCVWVKKVRAFALRPGCMAAGVLWRWLGYPFWISVFCIVSYLLFHEIYDILFTSAFFGLLDVIVKIVRVFTKKETQ